MWTAFFSFDLRYQLRQPLLWILTLPLVLGAFFSAGSDSFRIGGAIGNAHLNAPVVIVQQLAVMSIIALFLVTVFVAGALLRDREAGMADLLFATPMRTRDYLFGRSLAGFASCLAVFALIVLAMMLGSRMPGVDPARLSGFSLRPYAWGFLVYAVPNLLFVSALLVLLAVRTRSMMMVYVGVLAFIALWSIAGFLGGRAENAALAVLLDPFGVRVLAQATRYFTGADLNARLPELAGAVLLNRALWSALAVGMFGAAFWLFRPPHAGAVYKAGRRATRAQDPAVPAPAPGLVPRAPHFGRATGWYQAAALLRSDVRGVLRSVPFLIMLLLALANFLANTTIGGMRLDSVPYPLTRLMLEELGGGMNDMLTIILLVFSGELVHRDRQARMDGLTGALPVPAWAPALAHASALVAVVYTFLLAGVVAAIGIQLVKGGVPLEPLLYAKGTLIASAPFVIQALGLLALHMLARNKYVGHALGIGLLASGPILRAAGVEHNLAAFASLPALQYSDLNGYGHYLAGWAWFVVYWGLAAAGLLALALAPRGLRVRAVAGAVLCFSACAATGGWIWYNTAVLNVYRSSSAELDYRAGYEHAYRSGLALPTPSLAGVQTEVDIDPAARVVRIRGHYLLENRTGAPLQRLRIQTDTRAVTRFDHLPGQLVRNDALYGVQDWQLDQPLAAGARMTLAFTATATARAFTNDGKPQPINGNGTLFAFEDFFPKLGYNPSLELDDDQQRRVRGLGPVHRLPSLGDPAARAQNYWKQYGIDGDFMGFETTVSTSADQVALAPGALLGSWEREGRRYFHYKMERPVLPFFGLQSARWEVRRATWNGVPIAVYFDPRHPYNVDRMLAGAQGALAYATSEFGPYPYHEVRIAEAPLYQSYARAFPTLVPFSESLGFISDLRDPHAADHVFYVTAHELAHSWWGDQAAAANMQGSGLITEGLAEYTALMALERRYGPEMVRSFLRFDLDEYLRGRTREGASEQPLVRNEGQIYLQYRKASLALYRLRTEIGEAAVNRALRRFLDATRFRARPYASSSELLAALRAETPADSQDLLTDLFERIVFYDNRVLASQATRRPDGRWDVAITLHLAKSEADRHGRETTRQYDEPVEVAVYAGARALALVRPRLAAGDSTLHVTVAERPDAVAVDPRLLLIDKVQADNRRAVTVAD